MRKIQAIQALINQIKKIDDPSYYEDETWVFQTCSFIKDFFGEGSTEYSYISRFSFAVIVTDPFINKEQISNELANRRVVAKKFLEECIETLEYKGLYKKPQTNFLQNFSDTGLWTMLTLAASALVTCGLLFGQYTADVKNFDLRQENRVLKDSLIMYRRVQKPAIEKKFF